MGWFRSLRRGVIWISLGAAGGAAYVTVRHLLQTPQPLESALPGEARIDRRHGGDIFFNVAGPTDAAPLVLLHDFYPGASNFDFRNVFARLSKNARVYAPDWLGFGMSEHPHVAYTGEFYAGVLGGFLRDTVQRPATVLAYGLAGNAAVRAASDMPDLVDRLILVSPEVTAGEGPEPTAGQVAVRTAQRAALGLVPYALVSTRAALRWIANGRSATTVADEEQVDHLFASAHQFGGQHALLALLTGELDLPVRNALQTLRPPVLLVVGADDPKRPVGAMAEVAALNAHVDLEVVPDAGAAVFEDQPAAFIDAIEAWIGVPKSRHIPQPSIRTAESYLGASNGGSAGRPQGEAAAKVARAGVVQPTDVAGASAGDMGEVDVSSLRWPMDDMGTPVPELEPTDIETDRPLEEDTGAAYTPADLGAGEADGLAWLSGASQQYAAGRMSRPTDSGGATAGSVGAASGVGMVAPGEARGDEESLSPFEEEVGAAGYVTPGVSDMGLEGPSTETINSGTVFTDDAAGAPAASAISAAPDLGEAPSDMIPEAGGVARADNRDELEAREGVNPEVDAGMNIGDPPLVGAADGAAEGVDEGPAFRSGEPARRGSAGATGMPVATPETAVSTPRDAVVTAEGAAVADVEGVVTPDSGAAAEDGELPTRPVRAARAETGPADATSAAEDASEEQPGPGSQRPARNREQSATRPLKSRPPSQSTSAAPRTPGARAAREGGATKGGSSGQGGRRNGYGGKGSGKAGGHQGHHQGHQGHKK